jgi:pyruvate-ferredoxin/flavodoxin oxidoreductase
MPKQTKMLDANEAVADVAYRASEVIAIYPITPASPMGEHADAWSTASRPNLWGTVPEVVEMQSEGGAAGTVHGSLQAGALTTTFTASQGLLLMLPNLYKIGGELTPFCFHVAARSLATHALSIFCDHSDVMAARATGMALLCSSSPQEAHDMALVGHAATLRSRIPFLHFFDGFRTSHEIAKLELLSDEDLYAFLSEDLIAAHRKRALNPDAPVVRGTAQNPDAFFQAREAINPFYERCPGIVADVFERLEEKTGRRYRLFEYEGATDAERVIVLMGSAAEAAAEAVAHLVDRGEKVGVLKVRLYRPLDETALLAALPLTVRAIAVLDRTKEPGAPGEPLFLDVLAACARDAARAEPRLPRSPLVVGGRYGLGSKEVTPACIKAALDELKLDRPRHSFTVGITDDVTHYSLPLDEDFHVEPEDVVRAVFYGLGADGTVSANKSSIKIIGDATDLHAQGYFVYDSKKAGAATVSHLRFGPRPIRSTYLIQRACFVACHRLDLMERFDVLETLESNSGTLLLNVPGGATGTWERLDRTTQEQLLEKRPVVWAIDAGRIAAEAGLGVRINTIMQACFFALAKVIDLGEAIRRIKAGVEESYGKRGAAVIRQNFVAIDAALAHLEPVPLPARVSAKAGRRPPVPLDAPDFVQRVTSVLLAGKGDKLPVSAFPVDGTWPLGTSKWEKRGLAAEIPIWEPDLCIQCNQCAIVCPHATIRAKVFEETGDERPFESRPYKGHEHEGMRYVLQVAPDDCTGCHLCVEMCPAKDKANPRRKAINMAAREPMLHVERPRWEAFLALPELAPTTLARLDAKQSQLLQPLFEFSSACGGCGETPYIKLLTQLFGDRALIANATGCSSIFGANLPTTPYTTNAEGRGPAWSNSLFEDNAEFGFGFRVAIDAQTREARRLVKELAPLVGAALAQRLLESDLGGDAGIAKQRLRIDALKAALRSETSLAARRLLQIADVLVERSVWLVGGDGWAYDIGYGGLDHVLAMGRDVNVLVLDTEVYSNTGGQQSKATPLGAAAKFAQAGKETAKKDLGLEAMSYGHVYVAQVALSAKVNQTVLAFAEAASYPGPSLIIAYSHCIAHGYDLRYGNDQQKKAVSSGVWPLYRFDPRRTAEDKPPLQLDSAAPSTSVLDYMRGETRFLMVERQDPARFKRLAAAAQRRARQRWSVYQQLASIVVPSGEEGEQRGSHKWT